MFLDVQIDKLTDCLVEHSTGKLVETEYKLHHNIMTPKEYKNWKYIQEGWLYLKKRPKN